MEHYTFIHPTPGLKTDLDDPKYANFYWTDHSDARLQEFLQDWVLKDMESDRPVSAGHFLVR